MEPVKFTFDKSFDAGAGNRHEEEIAALRQQAETESQASYKNGFDAGHAQALTEIESATVAVLEQIQASAQGLFAGFDAMKDQVSAESAQVAHMIGLKLAETVLSDHPTQEIEQMVQSVLNDVADDKRLVIRLNSGVAEVVEPRLREMEKAAGLSGEVVVAADPAMNPQDVTIEWGNGGVKRDFDAIQQSIHDHITGYVNALLAPNEPASHPETPDPKTENINQEEQGE